MKEYKMNSEIQILATECSFKESLMCFALEEKDYNFLEICARDKMRAHEELWKAIRKVMKEDYDIDLELDDLWTYKRTKNVVFEGAK